MQVIYCDALFLSPSGTSACSAAELTQQIHMQAAALAEHMRIPVVHAGCTLPAEPLAAAAEPAAAAPLPNGVRPASRVAEGQGYVREVRQLGYHVHWVDLLEIDGVSPYTYSEVRGDALLFIPLPQRLPSCCSPHLVPSPPARALRLCSTAPADHPAPHPSLLPQDLPWDEMLDQHTPGLQHRTADNPAIVIAALPRDDSPSAAEYVAEVWGKTAWTKDQPQPQPTTVS